jgi:hypothetical protein
MKVLACAAILALEGLTISFNNTLPSLVSLICTESD